mmetsp:Transcript_20759/g.67177  ORF Transcript_20759/g.67177 Transcript_20759/m.67177 type:complete len:200 (-) Transcript_20759:345-944(-)
MWCYRAEAASALLRTRRRQRGLGRRRLLCGAVSARHRFLLRNTRPLLSSAPAARRRFVSPRVRIPHPGALSSLRGGTRAGSCARPPSCGAASRPRRALAIDAASRPHSHAFPTGAVPHERSHGQRTRGLAAPVAALQRSPPGARCRGSTDSQRAHRDDGGPVFGGRPQVDGILVARLCAALPRWMRNCQICRLHPRLPR